MVPAHNQRKPCWAVTAMGIALSMVLVGCGANDVDASAQTGQESVPETQSAQMGDDVEANEAIRILVEGTEFQEADLAQRKLLAEELLGDLEQGGLVHDVYFDEEGQQYSFIYADGALGGIDLAPFDEEMN